MRSPKHGYAGVGDSLGFVHPTSPQKVFIDLKPFDSTGESEEAEYGHNVKPRFSI